jgi:mannan endo-1,4-beta-mannosidase
MTGYEVLEGKKPMKTLSLLTLAIILLCTSACKKDAEEITPTLTTARQITTGQPGMSDQSATAETKSLFCYLRNMMGKGLLVGQQLSTYSGQGFVDDYCQLNKSDCKTGVGSHPAILGLNYNKDGAILRAHIFNTYNQHGIITMHWPMDNPVTGGSAQDTTPAAYAILPGGFRHEFYKQTLDTLGNFFKSLVDSNNKLIPIIFRPFHENTGNNYWWAAGTCTREHYRELYQFTVSYLRDTLGVHNVLYAYAPSRPSDRSETYLYRYPGDKYVDIIAFDRYNKDNENYTELLLNDCRTVVAFAMERSKIAAISESGVKDGLVNTAKSNWFMTQFLTPLLQDTEAKKVAYWLTWTNSSPTSYWVPLSGQPTFNSFDKLYKDPYTLFLNDLPSTIYSGEECN